MANVRQGIAQSQVNTGSFFILSFEILIFSIALGLGFKSWYVFGASILLLSLFISNTYLSIAFSFLMIVGWGFIGYLIGSVFGGIAPKIVLSILAFVTSIGIHFSAVEHFRDLTTRGNYE